MLEEESSLILISNEELSELKISDSFLPPQQKILYDIIINFNSQKEETEFLSFYKRNSNYFNENDDTLLGKIRVNKSRLNHSLKDYDLFIDKSFKLYKINTMSLVFLKNEASKIIKKHIKSIKIYDAYSGVEKDNFLSEEIKNIFKSMIKHDDKNNSKSIEIISILNNTHTKEFYKEILDYQNTLNKNTINIKYIRNTFVQSSSLFYVLVNDVDNNNYIIYWEKITKWSVLTKVSPETAFSEKFYNLLNERFDYYFLDINGELHETNEVIDVSLDTFKNDFLYETAQLIKELKESLFLEDGCKTRFHALIKRLKDIQISFPNEEDSIRIIFHFIKLAEISFKLKESNISNIENLIIQIINSQVHLKIYRKLHNEIKAKNDSYLISKISIEKIGLQGLRHLLNTKNISLNINEKLFIIDLFPNYRWTTYEQICDSLNLIIERIVDTKIILRLFINDIDLILSEEKIMKIILRLIFDVLYNIKYDEKINQLDKDKLLKIDFLIYDSEIKNKINKLER